MQTLWQDTRYGLRMLRKSPGFTAVAVLTLALGIGANTSVFTVVRTVSWRALPYPNADKLVFLTERTKSIPDLSMSYADLLDWQKETRAFESVAAYQATNFNFEGNTEPERISGRNVSPNFFQLLGVTPFLGRGFISSDNQPGSSPVAVSSYAFWQTHLGANPNVVGTSIHLDGRVYTVLGVLPRDFSFETPADVYAPIGLLTNTFMMRERTKHPFIYAIARLKPTGTLSEAEMELDIISGRLRETYPDSNADVYAVAKPLQKELAENAQPTLLALGVAVGFLFLIGCANVANLVLARATRREGEIVVRIALGARRSRIARQLLTENCLLAFGGAVTGLILARVCLDGLRVLVPTNLKDMVSLRIDLAAFGFAFAASFLAAVVSGLVPILFVPYSSLNEALKEAGRTSRSESARHQLRNSLVVSEVALAVIVLCAAGLVLHSFLLATRVNPGFDLKNVLTMRIDLPHSKYPDDRQLNAFFRQALGKLQGVPGVDAAAAVMPLPFASRGYPYSFYVEGQPIPAPGKFPFSNFHFVTPDYFRAMEIPLLHGRDFSSHDDETSSPVAIVSENFARYYWPRSDAIGKRFRLGDSVSEGTWVTVIGIVGNTKESGLDAPTTAEFYLPYSQHPIPFMTFVVRTLVPPLAMSAALKDSVRSVDSVDPLYEVQTMQQHAADVLAGRRTNAVLFGTVGFLTVFLAAVGVYAVISYTVSQRTHDLGVRLALGAQPRAILWLVIGEGARLMLLAVGIGLIAALTLTRTISSLLFSVGSTDLLTFAGAALLLGLVTLIACYIPARRAMKVDPMVSLRYE